MVVRWTFIEGFKSRWVNPPSLPPPPPPPLPLLRFRIARVLRGKRVGGQRIKSGSVISGRGTRSETLINTSTLRLSPWLTGLSTGRGITTELLWCTAQAAPPLSFRGGTVICYSERARRESQEGTSGTGRTGIEFAAFGTPGFNRHTLNVSTLPPPLLPNVGFNESTSNIDQPVTLIVRFDEQYCYLLARE